MSAVPAPGLHDPVQGAQQAFRAALQALSRPGRIQQIGRAIDGLPLNAALAHLLLALTDEDTPVWWQQPDASLAHWLQFHTGARSTGDCAAAAFAVITQPDRMPPLSAFAGGSIEAPEQSATLLVEVESLHRGPVLHAVGPGIRDAASLCIAGLAGDFWSQWNGNHARFPQGVDLLFTCGDEVLGLPRSSRVRRLESVE